MKVNPTREIHHVVLEVEVGVEVKERASLSSSIIEKVEKQTLRVAWIEETLLGFSLEGLPTIR